jgi:hypothetical protein
MNPFKEKLEQIKDARKKYVVLIELSYTVIRR